MFQATILSPVEVFAKYQSTMQEVACLIDTINLQDDCAMWLDEKCRFYRDLALDSFDAGDYEKSARYHAKANRYAKSRAAVRVMDCARFVRWYAVASEVYAR